MSGLIIFGLLLTLMLTGISMQVTFYKGLFEKLGIKADMLQMGAFKGAAEP